MADEAGGKTVTEKAGSIQDNRSAEGVRSAFLRHMRRTLGKPIELASELDRYRAMAHVVRDRVMDDWIETVEHYKQQDVRVVAYLSAEFLLGPHLLNGMLNLGITKAADVAAEGMGLSLTAMADAEPEPGLGNGGLGRLAACYMDSLTTLEVPAIGYGLRYEFGIFRQEIKDGWQIEHSDKWLQYGNPWEIPASDASQDVWFGGHTETQTAEDGTIHWKWLPDFKVKGIAYDTPIPGFRDKQVNRLRLWKAEAEDSFDLEVFNRGDYMGAVRQKMESETISKVLYPPDETEQGKRLRLMQQYFFTSASLKDMVRLQKLQGRPMNEFHEKWTVQLNDTHPSIGIPELLRILTDEEGLEWEEAWKITQATFGYTNHTLLPEALEKWPLPIFSSLLPRHIEIIYEINRRFLKEMAAKFPNDAAKLERMSLIGEGGEKQVRMANLAVVGSKAVNGVAALHTQLLKEDTLKDFYEAFPERFSNKTNGVTPRRWMMLSDPPLTSLINESIGTGWHTDLMELKGLEKFVDDDGFLEKWRKRQEASKGRLSDFIQRTLGLTLNPASMFDVQVKRIHEYKRQHMNALHILSMYCRIKSGELKGVAPRTFLFGGKAAPSYTYAKLMIKLVCAVGELVGKDPDTKDLLQVVFVPDYSVSLGQRIYPAADLSEQISTAGKEASGTGCMKFMMNGAVAIGTLDGANIEIREEVGEENFFLFGMTAQQIDEEQKKGYRPRTYYEKSPLLKEVIDGLSSGRFTNGDRDTFAPIVRDLLQVDRFFVMADFDDYVRVQNDVSLAFADKHQWSKTSLLNTARSGKFSSDRAIREYCAEIWKVPVRR